MDLFLDTTVLIDKTFGDKDMREKIMDDFEGNRITVSSYAIGEIKYNILQQCCELYNILTPTSNIFEAILKCANNVWKPAWYNRMIKICMYLGDNNVYGNSEVVNYKRNLEMLIEQFDIQVLEYIDDIIRGENCVNCLKGTAHANLNTATGKFDLDMNSICEEQLNGNCKIREFVESNNIEFDKIKNASKNLVKSQKTNVRNLQALNKVHGKNCWNTGDSILCVELPQESYMYSTDKVVNNIIKLLEKNQYKLENLV